MPITYQQITDKEIHEQVRRKHQDKINDLKRVGFSEFYFFAETVQALGFLPLGLVGFIGVLVALFKEVVKIEGNLNVNVFNMIMVSMEYATYASPSALGVKFYTSFTDGTCIISTNFDTPAINDNEEKLYRFAAPRTVVATWKDHLRWVNKLILEGKEKDEHLSLEGYLKLVKREDNYLLKIMNKVFASVMLSNVVSVIISVSLLVGIAGFLLVLAFLAQALYPACIIVDEKTSFAQTVLMALGCIVVSWILARIQSNMFTMDGIGTKLFGRSLSSDSQGYISTKWLTLLIPILPVRSYRILGEYSNSKDKAQYSMIPLEKLDWKQISETIQEWWVRYLISALVIIGVIALPLWRCIG